MGAQYADRARPAREREAILGVVGHGLFLTEADEVIVEDESGAIRELSRSGSGPSPA